MEAVTLGGCLPPAHLLCSCRHRGKHERGLDLAKWEQQSKEAVKGTGGCMLGG